MTLTQSSGNRRGRPPRSSQQTDDIRLRVISAARTLFVQEGYAGVSMRKIAQCAGCSPAALYTLFPAKRQLLLHLWGELFEQLLVRMADCRRDTGAKDRLPALCRTFMDFWLARPNDYRAIFLIEDQPSDENDRYFVDSAGVLALLDILRDAIVEAQASGTLAPGDPEQVLNLLLCGMQGVLLNVITIPEYPWGDTTRLVDDMVRVLLAGLRGR